MYSWKCSIRTQPNCSYVCSVVGVVVVAVIGLWQCYQITYSSRFSSKSSGAGFEVPYFSKKISWEDC